MIADHDFVSLLCDFDCQSLDNHAGAVYGLRSDMTLALLNEVWRGFARSNGGSEVHEAFPLRANILTAMSDAVRPFYQRHMEMCLTTMRPWEHLYECSSPAQFRCFHMTAFPLAEGEGVLVVNSQCVEGPHVHTPCPPDDRLYRNEHGIITQCSHCRRIRRVEEPGTWDWVPHWVTCPDRDTSHGLCEPCVAFYYAESRWDVPEMPQPICTIPSGERIAANSTANLAGAPCAADV